MVVPESGLVVVEPLEVVVVVAVAVDAVVAAEVVAVVAGWVSVVETDTLAEFVPGPVETPGSVDAERLPLTPSWPAGAGERADSPAGSASHAAATPAVARAANPANAFCLRLYGGVMPCVIVAVASVGAGLGMAASSASNRALPSGGRPAGSFARACETSEARRAGASGR